MRKVIFSFFLILITISTVGASNQRNLRLAVFDNPQPDPSRNEGLQQFVNSYLAGINTAIAVAAKNGISITEKEFFYTSNINNVIQQASSVKSWKPDVIMGLSTSNDFLMSKAFFGDQVILSISATDPALSSLPTGFYSLGIPDTDAVNAIIKFIHQHYPKSNLFITAAAESKESVDFADLLAKKYKEIFPEKSVTERKFLTEDMEHLDFNKFMSGYHKNDVIVVMSIGYDSAIDLMNKITEHFKADKPVFVTSSDNWGDSKTPIAMTSSYDAFRIDTLAGGEDTNSYKVFSENYFKIYHSRPEDKISFVTYQTVMSVVDALIHFPSSNNSAVLKTAIFNSYIRALKQNPNWYRPPYYVVYKLQGQKEIFFEKLK